MKQQRRRITNPPRVRQTFGMRIMKELDSLFCHNPSNSRRLARQTSIYQPSSRTNIQAPEPFRTGSRGNIADSQANSVNNISTSASANTNLDQAGTAIENLSASPSFRLRTAQRSPSGAGGSPSGAGGSPSGADVSFGSRGRDIERSDSRNSVIGGSLSNIPSVTGSSSGRRGLVMRASSSASGLNQHHQIVAPVTLRGILNTRGRPSGRDSRQILPDEAINGRALSVDTLLDINQRNTSSYSSNLNTIHEVQAVNQAGSQIREISNIEPNEEGIGEDGGQIHQNGGWGEHISSLSRASSGNQLQPLLESDSDDNYDALSQEFCNTLTLNSQNSNQVQPFISTSHSSFHLNSGIQFDNRNLEQGQRLGRSEEIVAASGTISGSSMQESTEGRTRRYSISTSTLVQPNLNQIVSYDNIDGVRKGEKIVWFNGNDTAEIGFVRWLGLLRGVQFAGIEFMNHIGNSSGTWNGHRLFSVPLTKGRFLPFRELLLYCDFNERLPINSPASIKYPSWSNNEKSKDIKKKGSSTVICVICQDPLFPEEEEEGDGEPVQDHCSNPSKSSSTPKNSCLVSTPCGHLFHDECLRKWFNIKSTLFQPCPFCQRKINTKELIRIYPIQSK